MSVGVGTIRIGDYYLHWDGICWHVGEYVERRKPGRDGSLERKTHKSYHSTLLQACQNLIERSIDEADMESVQSLIDCINQSTDILKQTIEKEKLDGCIR